MNNTEKVDGYMKAVEEYLIKEYGAIPDAYRFQLDLFKENLLQYFEIKDIVSSTGYYDYIKGMKNPLLSTLKDLNAIILKQGTMFGLNVWAKSKIKITEEDNTDEFIDALTK